MSAFDKNNLWRLAEELFPLPRSLASPATLQTLQIIKRELPELAIQDFKSGLAVYDWNIPQEWHLDSATISNSQGEVIIDSASNPLHVIGYSESVDITASLDQLDGHIFFMEGREDTIPYLTSYYERTWGFCLTQKQYNLLPQNITCKIKSASKNGKMSYGDLVVKGVSPKEILFSTYICHPNLANNELSGPLVTLALVKRLQQRHGLRYSYRFLFIPETIGAIAYINRYLWRLKLFLKAGFVITCVGDSGKFSYIPSKYGNTYADKLATTILNETDSYNSYLWTDRGSDERQYCSPIANLPVCSVTRSKYGTYDEYHTSDDNLNFIDRDSLWESVNIYEEICLLNEANVYPVCKNPCEPRLSKYGLYENLTSDVEFDSRTVLHVLSYCDGSNDLIDIKNMCQIKWKLAFEILSTLKQTGLVRLFPSRKSAIMYSKLNLFRHIILSWFRFTFTSLTNNMTFLQS